MPARIIAHIDMDAFFAAVEERENAALRGKPLVVGADPRDGKGRGVVSTANYLARKYGIHSAMPISRAWRLSEIARRQGNPPAVFIRPDMNRYARAGERIVVILKNHVLVIERAGIDEAYFDLTFMNSYPATETLCRKIKAEIIEKEHLTASIGIGPNKLIAKIASDFQKPDGLTVVTDQNVEAFLAPMPIRKIPGIGPKTEVFLQKLGIRTIQEMRKFSESELQEMFGKWGTELYGKVRGRDESPLEQHWEPKSIGEQETFLKDTRDPNFIFERLSELCTSVIGRLEKKGFTGFRTVVVTVRFSDFQTQSRSYTFPAPVSTLKDLRAQAMRLFLPFLDQRENPKRKRIRLIGVRVEKLVGAASND
jgi:DNA polymerase IV (DinB-like DNA polymerase)